MLLNNGNRSSNKALRHLRPISRNDENSMLNRNINSSKEKSLSFATNNENAFSSKKSSKKMKDSMGGENLKLKASSSSFKSGSSKKQNRRAFGDISNRNKNTGATAIEKSKTGTKPKGLSVKTPHTNKTKNISTTSKRSNRTPFGSNVNKNSIIPKAQSQKSAGSQFVLPQRTVSFEQQKNNISGKTKLKNISSIDKRINVKSEPPVEDVEYPAGRLWHQEQSLLEDEEFNASIDFSEEINGLKEMLEEQLKAKIESKERRCKESSYLFDSHVKRYDEQRDIEDFSLSIDDEFAFDEMIHSTCADDLDNDFFLTDDISI